MIKQFACVATSLSLSFLIPLVVAPASFANAAAGEQSNVVISEQASALQPGQSSPTLRQGIPGRRVGGGTRSDLIFANASDVLTAITTPDPLTVTSASHPRLLFYVPEMLSDNTVEFVLRDRQDNLIYETTFTLAREAGTVSVDLADSGLPALSLNENYQWYFSIVPNALDRANDVVVHGSVRRVDSAEWLALHPAGMALAEQLVAADPLEQARLYRQANLWHDAALILDSLYQADPENVAIATAWSQLLQSAGLSNIDPTQRIPKAAPPIQIGLHPDL